MGGDLVTRNLGESKRESANSRTSSGDENPRGFRPIWRCTVEVLGWSQFVSPVQCLGCCVEASGCVRILGERETDGKGDTQARGSRDMFKRRHFLGNLPDDIIEHLRILSEGTTFAHGVWKVRFR